MNQREIDKTLARHLTPVRAIAIGFSSSVVLYIAAGWFLIENVLSQPILPLPFVVTAGVAIAQLTVILAGYLISNSIRSAASGGGSLTAGVTSGGDALMKVYTRSVVVACALREVAAVSGFVLSLLTSDLTWVLLLGGASLISMAVHWPRRGAVEEWLSRHRGND